MYRSKRTAAPGCVETAKKESVTGTPSTTRLTKDPFYTVDKTGDLSKLAIFVAQKIA